MTLAEYIILAVLIIFVAGAVWLGRAFGMMIGEVLVSHDKHMREIAQNTQQRPPEMDRIDRAFRQFMEDMDHDAIHNHSRKAPDKSARGKG